MKKTLLFFGLFWALYFTALYGTPESMLTQILKIVLLLVGIIFLFFEFKAILNYAKTWKEKKTTSLKIIALLAMQFSIANIVFLLLTGGLGYLIAVALSIITIIMAIIKIGTLKAIKSEFYTLGAKNEILVTSEYAGFLERLVARMIDNFIAIIIPVAILFSLAIALNNGMILLILVAWLLIPANLYFIYFHKRTGQTIGKRMLNIKVVKENGESLSWGDAILRWIGYRISAIVLYLGLIWIAIDKNKQGWHDQMAKTYVKRVK